MTILAKIGFCRKKNYFLPAKTIFASPVFTAEKNAFSTFRQKPTNPEINSLHGTEFWRRFLVHHKHLE